jgi:hypothetical protein
MNAPNFSILLKDGVNVPISDGDRFVQSGESFLVNGDAGVTIESNGVSLEVSKQIGRSSIMHTLHKLRFSEVVAVHDKHGNKLWPIENPGTHDSSDRA